MDHPSDREIECTYALILINHEQLVVNQLEKGLDIVNDDLLLPHRVTGVDPSLAMVEEARFLLLRSILTMRMIMMKTMLKKSKSLQCCVWYVNGMCTAKCPFNGQEIFPSRWASIPDRRGGGPSTGKQLGTGT